MSTSDTATPESAAQQGKDSVAAHPSGPPWLAALVHKVPVGIVVIDDEGQIIWCNEELCVQFRSAARDLIGIPIERLLPERFRQNHVLFRKVYTGKPMARPMGTGRALHGLRADGTEFPVEIGLRPLDTSDGPRFVATVVDITARRNAEDTFQRVIEAAPCGMLVLDRQQTIQLVNEQLLATFGYAREELHGQLLETLIPMRHRGVHSGHVAKFARNPATRSMGPGRDLTGLHRNGSEFPVEIGLRPVLLHSGPCVLATVIDVTDRKRVEMHLRRANADLEEFAYAASHDLRTPLRGISDLTDWIAEGLGDQAGADVKNNLRRLKVRTQRMDSLITSMLEYARAGADRSEPEAVDVATWLQELREFASVPANATCRLETSVPTMIVQKTPLSAALRNLLCNALQHNDTPNPEVLLKVEPQGAYYQFDVIDNGPGVPPEAAERIFKLFQRLRRNDQGTGIGLALVKRVVETHGGSIHCMHRIDGGRGAQFRVMWPQSVR